MRAEFCIFESNAPGLKAYFYEPYVDMPRQQASRTVDEHHLAREEMENQREGSTEVHVPAFTVRHVVVLLTTQVAR